MKMSEITRYVGMGTQLLKKILISKDVISLEPIGEQKGQVLLSYITTPFQSHVDLSSAMKRHTNIWECLEITRIWREHGYAVDVIDYTNTMFKPRKQYDFVIDIHHNLERLAPLLHPGCIKILHITGSHWLFQNTAEYQRLLDLQQRRGITLYPKRLAPFSLGIEHADCATILGNGYAKTTFLYSGKPLYSISPSTTIKFPFFEDKNYSKCKKNFIWFGSSGMVHKGLDLVLEAFSQMPDYHLTVCGPIKAEKDFETAYSRELYDKPNITTLGWMDVEGESFNNVLNNSIALVFPSCSEAGIAASVVVCLHGGLIPIVSRHSAGDVEDFGITLEECTIEEIKQSVRYIAQLPEETLKEISYKAWSHANNNYTREQFSKSYQQFVDEIITQHIGH
jgi:glycosyltransferase involved in cell wall biosynthesis